MASARRRLVHLSDAPRDRPGPARGLPDLRHGARAAHDRRARRAPNPELRRHDAAVLDRRGAAAAGRRRSRWATCCSGRSRPSASTSRVANWVGLVAGDAGRALGRVAVLRARLALDREPQPEHVHADRRWASARRIVLQRGRDARPGLFPACVPRCRAAVGTVFRGGGRDRRRWCCSARCSSCARGAGRARRIRALLRSRAEDGAAHRADGSETRRAARPTCRSAIAARAARARRCRSTASSSRAQRVDESMVTGEPMPVRKQARRRASSAARSTAPGRLVMRAERVGARHAARADRRAWSPKRSAAARRFSGWPIASSA